ncbi:McrB family protein [Floricoccus penangensis]|uniref:McrB family protein n=1 Tax=Floricoccus penangensis TaxID=1859475 RepID=UPI00203FBF55|nr:AAA family ATPase [Floricoccus penangensis]URZ88375.1 AAA family ATPase [Floricoccus penangensis]
MTDIYISKETIKKSYDTLIQTDCYVTEFFGFLLLKHAGISQYDYINLSDDSVKEKIVDATKRLSWLFLDDANFQNKDAKNNFINPFSMSDWGNNPSESIKKWAPSRLINNVTGGGKQWKTILTADESDPNILKLKHNYFDFFNKMTIKYPLDAISIWFVRFSKFSRETAQSSINNDFYTYFNINEEEKSYFFSTANNIDLVFNNEPTDPKFIRSLIGNPKTNKNWIESSDVDNSNLTYYNFQNSIINNSSSNINVDEYKKMLDNANQAILMGPPGTSKSYMANLLSKEFNNIKRIQFHPQYSYQNFIGGKILNNGTLSDQKGEFIKFLDLAIKNKNEDSYLLVIEEINRANVSQVFGELIQLLDRNEKLKLSFNGNEEEYYLPENLKIIGTMNTTDRTVGRIDYAIKRRFYQVYFGVDYDVIIDNVLIQNNSFSIADLLQKINSNLLSSLNNKEMVIGHAIFLKDFVKSQINSKYIWKVDDFVELFNYVILPIVEDYCNGNLELIRNILGENLIEQLSGDEFVQEIKKFLSK